MPEVPARDHLKTLIEFYQAADKLHRQAEADVVFAKKRRDEARALKADAFDWLEAAKKKYDVADLEFPDASPARRESSRRLVKKAVVRKSSIRAREGEKSPHPQPSPDEEEGNNSEKPSSSPGYAPLSTQDELNVTFKGLSHIPNLTEQDTPGITHRNRKLNLVQDSTGQGSTGAVHRGRKSKQATISDVAGQDEDMHGILDTSGTPHRSRKSKMVQVHTSNSDAPHGKSKKRLSPTGARRSTMSKSHSLHKRSIPLESKNMDLPILAICRGRSREWYEANFDAERLGLAKRFYQAALGTKTHAATNQLYISSVLLNDEWNSMATTTSEVQELYIGVSKSADGKETLRDRAARALVQPPQQEPVAIFYAPKNTRRTDEIFYGGHWKVVAGNMLEPPRVVKGMPRQCLAKFVFCGINSDIVKAVNGE